MTACDLWAASYSDANPSPKTVAMVDDVNKLREVTCGERPTTRRHPPPPPAAATRTCRWPPLLDRHSSTAAQSAPPARQPAPTPHHHHSTKHPQFQAEVYSVARRGLGEEVKTTGGLFGVGGKAEPPPTKEEAKTELLAGGLRVTGEGGCRSASMPL